MTFLRRNWKIITTFLIGVAILIVLHLLYGNKGNKKCDITSDNEEVRGSAYQSGYIAGEASVDVTTNDPAISSAAYNEGFTAGAASVDVTTNDPAISSAAYNEGFTAGAASVDVTSNDDAVSDAAYLAGKIDYQIENGINQNNKCTFTITQYQTMPTPTATDTASSVRLTQVRRDDVRTYWMGPSVRSGTSWLPSRYKIEVSRNDPSRYDCYAAITRPSAGANNNWNFPADWRTISTRSTASLSLPNNDSSKVTLFNGTLTKQPDIITLYAKQTRISS
jgi:hypothetical protein